MIAINRAKINDYNTIVAIGNISVKEAHRESCPPEVLNGFIEKNYNAETIKAELSDEKNIYHIISTDGEPAGFSKIIFDAAHPNIEQQHVTKLDRIYLLNKFFDRRLGYDLLTFNIDLCKRNNQSAIWLYTWIENDRAVRFYQKNGFTIIGNHDFQVSETHYNPNYQMLLQLA